jgi:hypothetical protein
MSINLEAGRAPYQTILLPVQCLGAGRWCWELVMLETHTRSPTHALVFARRRAGGGLLHGHPITGSGQGSVLVGVLIAGWEYLGVTNTQDLSCLCMHWIPENFSRRM